MTAAMAMGAVIWAVCGIWAAGALNAYFQRNWPSIREDTDFVKSVLLGCFGPFSAASTLIFWLIMAPDFFSFGWSLRHDAVKNWERR